VPGEDRLDEESALKKFLPQLRRDRHEGPGERQSALADEIAGDAIVGGGDWQFLPPIIA
jgi:hypothetical protein